MYSSSALATSRSLVRTSARVNSMKVSPIQEIELLAETIPGVLSLGQGIPSFATPVHIREFVMEKISKGATDKYSLGPGISLLRDAIAEKLLNKNGIHADPSKEILVTAGANEALSLSVLAVVDPGDEVLVTVPGYPPHFEQIRMAGGTPVFVPLSEDNNWELDTAALEQAITSRTKAIVICTPLNPTGSVLGEETLRVIAEIALRQGLFVITDETYEDFVYDDKRHFSMACIPELKDLTISNFSFSKSYALTGWRCGYVHASAPMISHLLKLHDALCICASLSAQYAGLAALTGSQAIVAEFRTELERRRNLILNRIRGIARFKCNIPEGAYYILVRIEDIDDAHAYCLELLRSARVVIVPGAGFGPTTTAHARLSYCMSEEVINEAFDRIASFEAGIVPTEA
jgi:aminotransferase